MVAYSFKKRFVVPISLGLGISYAIDDVEDIRVSQPKRQTIRARGKRRHARVGDELQLYTGMRSKQCRLIGRARCSAVERIAIWPDCMAIMVATKLQTARQIQAFAHQDGFADIADMQQFWLKEHGPEKFEGIIVRWVPLQ